MEKKSTMTSKRKSTRSTRKPDKLNPTWGKKQQFRKSVRISKPIKTLINVPKSLGKSKPDEKILKSLFEKYSASIPNDILFKFLNYIDTLHDLYEGNRADANFMKLFIKKQDGKNRSHMEFLKWLATDDFKLFEQNPYLKELMKLNFKTLKDKILRLIEKKAMSSGVGIGNHNHYYANINVDFNRKLQGNSVVNYIIKEPNIHIMFNASKKKPGTNTFTTLTNLQHSEFSDKVIITPAQIFDPSETAYNQKFTFVFMNYTQYTTNQDFVTFPQRELNQLYSKFSYKLIMPKNLIHRITPINHQFSKIENCKKAELEEMKFICTRTHNSNGSPSPFLNELKINVDHNRKVDFVGRDNVFYRVTKLQGLSVQQLTKECAKYIIANPNLTIPEKRNIVRIALDWKRQGDSYQFKYANEMMQYQFVKKEHYIISTFDKLAFTMGLFYGVNVIFESGGMYHIYTPITSGLPLYQKFKKENKKRKLNQLNTNNNKNRRDGLREQLQKVKIPNDIIDDLLKTNLEKLIPLIQQFFVGKYKNRPQLLKDILTPKTNINQKLQNLERVFYTDELHKLYGRRISKSQLEEFLRLKRNIEKIKNEVTNNNNSNYYNNFSKEINTLTNKQAAQNLVNKYYHNRIMQIPHLNKSKIFRVVRHIQNKYSQ